jgi:hypothetical protein
MPKICLLVSFLWAPVAAAQSSDLPSLPPPVASAASEPPARAPPPPPVSGSPGPASPAPPSAAPPPPAPELRRSGAYVHDGFYFRVGIGPAYTGLSGSGPAGAVSLGGGGVGLTLAIGGTLENGIVLAGIVHGANGESNNVIGSPGGPGTVWSSLVEFAFLVDWYPDPRKGWHVDGAIGAGDVEVDGSNGTLFGGALTGSILGGYDWWLGPEWSLGLLLVATGGSKAALDDSSGVDTGYRLRGGSIAVEGSILFH